ncbi:hypothetical protein K402DRAFT_361410 [Aulographum hederae CBS 113979]|uniref:LrgB-domain-containing protein n=1 Tax=Aulographum hederae CBS 113979 TaxID=1176131 RepID=A0A6G1GQV8_9PEZI|nr:hypothetical protein K402DRAFT_361410 [Aulographum hederae CBS 113979]
MPVTQEQPAVKDLLEAVLLVSRLSWPRLLTAWVYTPVGILIILLVLFGINALISLSSVSFPSSVAGMIILFACLLGFEAVFGERKTKYFVSLVDVPGGFALRYINVLFCPAFVLIPLSPSISGVEIGKIIGVFVLGYAALFAATAYLTRALQLVLGTSKRAVTERAEEMGTEQDDIPLTDVAHNDHSPSRNESEAQVPLLTDEMADEIQAPTRAQNPEVITGTGGPPLTANAVTETHSSSMLRQNPVPPTRPQRWAALINANLDLLTYSAVFVFAGIPVYYGAGYAMPAQLTLNIIAFFAALSLPARWRRIAHPTLVASIITIFGVWILALIRGDSLKDGLRAYQTKTRYIQVFSGQGLPMPGAGDLLSSTLDMSIVALALPMFQYRHELKRSFFPIFIPNVSMAIASLFGYPAVCHAIGISSTRSLSFASRSLTLALATPATQNLGGDLNLVAVLCILTGIAGVIVGPAMLKYLRIPEDDYITRGVTLGGNSSAIATALLLTTDPRAAAFSSLSMGLFGAIVVAFTSVPPLVRIVSELAGK